MAGFQIWDDGDPFVFNGVGCSESHTTYSVTVRLGRYNDIQNKWVTKDTVTKTCGTGFSCYASQKATFSCSPGDTAQWRVRVTSSIGTGTPHTPTDIGGPVLLTCHA